MNLFSDIGSLVTGAIAQLQSSGDLPGGLDLGPVTVEPPRDPLHGDMATNAAMVLAKPAGLKPRVIAEALAPLLAADPRVTSAEVAGPGFLNLRLAPIVWQDVARGVLVEGTAYGRSTVGQGERVNVEYVSANPTGPLHVGHTRGAVFGDALANLLAYAGYDVTREYYINDGGAQVDVLARSVYLRYQEAHDLSVDWPEGSYPGDYLIEVGEALKAKVGERLPRARRIRVAGRCAQLRDRGHARSDPCGSEVAQRRDGFVLFGKVALRHRTDRAGDRRAGCQGPDLPRRARAAQGQEARRLGAARTDPVQIDRPWRRRRPPDSQVRRRMDLFRPGHCLSL